MLKSYREDYPRPQLVRDSWQNLNGSWDFAFDDALTGIKEAWYSEFPEGRSIEVPYTYETAASGIADESHHPCVWYHRSITWGEVSKQVLLHFEGSDYLTDVWVNGTHVGSHQGGYSRFSFEISPYVKSGDNDLTVCVRDYPDEDQPRGKQRWVQENFGCWYVQTTGIWKTVWLEEVPAVRLDQLRLTTSLKDLSLHLEADFSTFEAELALEIRVSYKDIEVARANLPIKGTELTTVLPLYNKEVNPFGAATWAPGHPNLYDIKLTLTRAGEPVDKVLSYFGLREIRIDGDQIALNGSPLYQRLILDQGYWQDSHLTPPNEAALIEDIDKILALGYNGLRKHQKTEDERFLYWCDVKGVLVWSEFPATYRYTSRAVDRITREWLEIVQQNYNHPSIITWAPFNESWGIGGIATERKPQQFTEAIYHLTKALDDTRPVIVNDGWEHTVSDIITLHDYVQNGPTFVERYHEQLDRVLANEFYFNGQCKAFADGYSYKGQPIIISEFGGTAIEGADGWGYGNHVKDEAEFLKRFDEMTTAIKSLPRVAGYCYTQVSDVQQEINGLMDMERNYKVDPEAIREINERWVGKLKS